jgi:hypothetical protein
MAGGVVVAGDGGGGARVKCEEWPFAGRSTIFSFCFFFLKSERIFVGSVSTEPTVNWAEVNLFSYFWSRFSFSKFTHLQL